VTSFFRKFTWWRQRRRKEDELREELTFHLAEEAGERQAGGLSADQARWAARRDLGNVTRLREDTRTLWSWILVEQLAQDIRYGLRNLRRNPGFDSVAAWRSAHFRNAPDLALIIDALRLGDEGQHTAADQQFVHWAFSPPMALSYQETSRRRSSSVICEALAGGMAWLRPACR